MNQRPYRWSFFLNISEMAPGLALQTWHSQVRRIEPKVTPLYINVNRVESRLYSRGPSGIFGETRQG